MTAFDEAWLSDYQARRNAQKGRDRPPAPDLVEFSIPVALKMPNTTNSRHWSTQYTYRKRLVPIVKEALKPWLGRQPILKARVTIVRYSTNAVDPDGAVASAKPLIDLLLIKSRTHPHSFGIMFDDGPQDIELTVRGEIVRHKTDVRTTVRIERV